MPISATVSPASEGAIWKPSRLCEQKFPKKLDLPSTLFDAAGLLRKSKAARDLFGDAFVEHYAQSREWEEREFRKAITDWEMERYFEII